MEKKRIICIIGPSGSGKTTLTKVASEHLNIPTICSYTTRPMRDGEVDGVDHLFITQDEMCTLIDQEDILAYTNFGGYDYCAVGKQISDCAFYVIDEAGVNYLLSKPGYDVFTVFIQADDETLKERGVSQERIDRDKHREALNTDINMVFYNDAHSLHVASSNFAIALENKLIRHGWI